MNDKKQMGQEKLKKILLVLVIGFIIVGGVSAAYFMSVSSSKITGQIIGGGDQNLVITTDLQDFELNVNTSAQVNTQNFTIFNENNWITTSLDLNITDIETDNNCNGDGDITIELFNNTGFELSDGDNITLSPGTNNFKLVTNAVKRSCPRNITTQIILTQI